MATVIDSLLIALGFQTDTKGITEAKRAADDARASMISMGTALTGIVAGLALHKVAEIGSTFEQNRNAIAGFMQALGLSSNFNDGLEDASAIMRQITNDAARLPGEADEYIEVFRAGLPELKAGMPGASAIEMAKFTNTITALGKTLKIDAPQIGRDLKLMLGAQGRAGGHVKTFQDLLAFMRLVPGQANLNAQSFNAMSQEARVALLQQTFASDGLQSMLNASASSFDAMTGALKSGITQMVRLGTMGLFEGMKEDLDDLNKTFFDADGNLTETGKDVVEMIAGVSRVVARLLRDGKDLVVWLAHAAKHSTAFKVAVVGLLGIVAGSAWTTVAAKVAKFAAGLKLATVLTGFLALALGLLIEDVYGFYTGADSVTGMLVEKWEPAIYAVIAAIVGLTLVLSPVLLLVGLIALAVYGLYSNWDKVLLLVEGGLNAWVDIINQVIDGLNAVGKLFGASEIGKVGQFYFSGAAHDQSMLAPGEGVLAGDMVGPAQPMGPSWLMQGTGFGNGGMTGATTSYGPVTFGDINITAPDAKSAGREVQRRIRTAQSGIKR